MNAKNVHPLENYFHRWIIYVKFLTSGKWYSMDNILIDGGIYYIIIKVFCPSAGPSLQAQELRLKFFRRQVFHDKLRIQGCSFTRDSIGAVASRCIPHPTLWKDPRGTSMEVRRVDMANWALRNSQQGLNIYIYIYIYVCICIYIYIYIYAYRQAGLVDALNTYYKLQV